MLSLRGRGGGNAASLRAASLGRRQWSQPACSTSFGRSPPFGGATGIEAKELLGPSAVYGKAGHEGGLPMGCVQAVDRWPPSAGTAPPWSQHSRPCAHWSFCL